MHFCIKRQAAPSLPLSHAPIHLVVHCLHNFGLISSSATMAKTTWLDRLQEKGVSCLPQQASHLAHSDTEATVKIDIDCMDSAEARRFLPFKPHDQTSNQRLVYEQMISPENRELFLQTVKEGKDEGWEVILNRIVCIIYQANRQLSHYLSPRIERPPLRQEHRQPPRPCSSPSLGQPRLRHRQSCGSSSLLRPRI